MQVSIGHQQYRVDQVIVYRSTNQLLNYELMVHRIVAVNVNATDGIVGYITKGDNNPVADNAAGYEPPQVYLQTGFLVE